MAPSQPNSSRKVLRTASGRIRFPCAITDRLRLTATRNSWRNSGSISSIVPCQFASMVRARPASTVCQPTIAGCDASSGTAGELSKPAGSAPLDVMICPTTSCPSVVHPIALSSLRARAAGFGWPRCSVTSIINAGEWPSVIGSCSVSVTAVLPSRSRRTAVVTRSVNDTTGSRARIPVTAARRERNGPAERSAANRVACVTGIVAGGEPLEVRTRTESGAHRNVNRIPAWWSRPSNVSSTVLVDVTGWPTTKPLPRRISRISTVVRPAGMNVVVSISCTNGNRRSPILEP